MLRDADMSEAEDEREPCVIDCPATISRLTLGRDCSLFR